MTSAVVDAPPAKPVQDVYAKMDQASSTRGTAPQDARVKHIRLLPHERVDCATATPPDFYVSAADAAKLSGADAPDLGERVRRQGRSHARTAAGDRSGTEDRPWGAGSRRRSGGAFGFVRGRGGCFAGSRAGRCAAADGDRVGRGDAAATGSSTDTRPRAGPAGLRRGDAAGVLGGPQTRRRRDGSSRRRRRDNRRTRAQVGPIEDRIPAVQYLSTPEACYRYGCYVLPTGAEDAGGGA